MVLFANASYLNNCELEIASIARQTRRVEQSSDRQVALNCHCEGHFVFLQINNLSAHIVINFVYIFSCQGGLPPPLNPPVYFLSNLTFSEPLKSAKLNKLFGLGFHWDLFTPTEAFSSSFATAGGDSWQLEETARLHSLTNKHSAGW